MCSTGNVTYRGANGKGYTTKLYKWFYQRYREQHPEAGEMEALAFIGDMLAEKSRWHTYSKGYRSHHQNHLPGERSRRVEAIPTREKGTSRLRLPC